jgi:hypothetical protein
VRLHNAASGAGTVTRLGRLARTTMPLANDDTNTFPSATDRVDVGPVAGLASSPLTSGFRRTGIVAVRRTVADVDNTVSNLHVLVIGLDPYPAGNSAFADARPGRAIVPAT